MSKSVETYRNEYRKLMHACLRSERKLSTHLPNNAEWFNNHVESLIHEYADGEPGDYSPAMYVRCAEQVACEVYGVDFRALTVA